MSPRAAGLLLAAAVTLVTALPARAAGEGTAADIRVIIDVSGSMQKNDPDNLRASAVQLFVNLLPDGVRSGVWTFGKHVNLQVDLAEVGPAWRTRAERAAAEIHSRGLFTDIESALERATRDWLDRPVEGPRHVILLTDGVVDVSEDAADSERSRARILDTLEPRLVAAGIAVHTLALSENADAALLERLSRATAGTHLAVRDAAELERLFLRLVEHSAAPDTVPIEAGGFLVDASVDEMTVLVFREAAETETRLLTPDGRFFEAAMDAERVRWRRRGGYELITVREPTPGRWRIDGADDPDNRVAVVTDLRLRVSDTPGHLLPDRPLTLEMSLTQGATVLADPGMRELVDWTVLRDAGTAGGEYAASAVPRDDGAAPDVEAGDGRFAVTLAPDGAEGVVELVITADSGTFQRRVRRMITVRWPVDLRRETGADGGDRFVLEPRPQAMDPGSLAVRARWLAPGAEPLELAPDLDDAGRTVIVPPPADAVGEHVLAISVAGIGADGEAFEHALPATVFPGLPAPAPEPAPAESTAPDGLVAIDVDHPPDWRLAAGAAGALGLTALLLVGLRRRSRSRRAAQLLDGLDLDDTSPEPA